MKWTKINQRTGEPIKGRGSFEPHDYIAGEYKIINNEWRESKNGWILTKGGQEIGRFNTLKAAKAAADDKEVRG